jgi:hypothetical protein
MEALIYTLMSIFLLSVRTNLWLIISLYPNGIVRYRSRFIAYLSHPYIPSNYDFKCTIRHFTTVIGIVFTTTKCADAIQTNYILSYAGKSKRQPIIELRIYGSVTCKTVLCYLWQNWSDLLFTMLNVIPYEWESFFCFQVFPWLSLRH